MTVSVFQTGPIPDSSETATELVVLSSAIVQPVEAVPIPVRILWGGYTERDVDVMPSRTSNPTGFRAEFRVRIRIQFVRNVPD